MDPSPERNTVLIQVGNAGTLLVQSMSPKLVPATGAQIGYAIRGARDANGVAAVSGRISVSGDTVHPAGPCAFGTDREIARVILTVMKFDPRRRCAAFLRFSDRALAILEGDLFLECISYDASRAPPGISTMDWGIASCCRDEVPDVIYAGGTGSGDAPLILLGEEPAAVANNIIICSNRI